jgi:tripartite-type tricarboxylate transporter receptor subunit TctC
LLQQQAGIKLLMVPYSGGTAQIISDMMGKRVGLVLDAYSGSASRMPDSPNLPTVAETLPGFESVGWQALLAPAGTPDAIVRKVNADLIKAMHDPDIRKRLADLGRDDRPMTPADLSAFIQNEQKKWGPIEQQIAAQTQKK